ncbi:MAG: class I SAM-dependent methyltransferase [Candidatus Limnocylindria bacterium]
MALDPSDAYIRHARTQLPATARCTVGDAHSLPITHASFDVCVSGLVLNFVQRPTSGGGNDARAGTALRGGRPGSGRDPRHRCRNALP